MADHQQEGQEGGGTTGSMHYCFPRVTTCNSDTCQTGAAGAHHNLTWYNLVRLHSCTRILEGFLAILFEDVWYIMEKK